MAIDTRAKRNAALIDFSGSAAITPDGSIANSTDRANQEEQYFAGAAAAVVAPVLTIEFAPGVAASAEPTAGQWINITSYCRYAKISRGRSKELDKIKSGTLTITLNNKTRLFDPSYTSGTYYGQLLPNVHIRVTALFNSTTYYLYRGFVNGWPQSYPMQGKQTEVTITANDAFKIFAKIKPITPWEKLIRRDKPLHWWRLNDSSFIDQGFASAQYPGVPTGTFSFNNSLISGDTTNLSANFDGTTNLINFNRDASVSSSSFTFECWMKSSGAIDPDKRSVIFGYGTHLGLNTKDAFSVFIEAPNSAQTPNRLKVSRANIGVSPAFNPETMFDNVIHHVAFTFLDGIIEVYVDGINTCDMTGAVSYGTTMTIMPMVLGYQSVSADYSPALTFFSGSLDEVCIYDEVLTSTQLLDHYNAGISSSFLSTNKTGTRIGLLLDNIDWPSSLRDIDTGNTTVGVITNLPSFLLEYLQKIETSENGRLYITGRGYVRFIARHNYLTETTWNTSLSTFGDDLSTEDPYSNIEIDYDDQLIYNEIVCTSLTGEQQVATNETSIDTFYINNKSE